jgi:hypothetical protein
LTVQINVYTAREEPLSIDEIVAGLRSRGVDATWEVDENLAEAGAAWNAGSLVTPDGQSLELGWQKIFPSEKGDLEERSGAISADAAALAPDLKNSYRLIARSPGQLSWATADTIAELTPSLILDVDSGALYDREQFRDRSPGAPED